MLVATFFKALLGMTAAVSAAVSLKGAWLWYAGVPVTLTLSLPSRFGTPHTPL